MWAGDFNRHHPIWDEPRNAHLFTRENLDLTQPLLNMLARHGMKMALPPFIPTLQGHNTGNHTRVDNVFCTEDLMNTIIKCNTDDATCPVKTDHYPIITRLDIHAMRTAWEPRPNFRLTDWGELIKTLRTNLTNIPTPIEIENIKDFNVALDRLSQAIQEAIA
jgi:Endonuclease-reverse transcriptase